jgi:hypothetical protein
VEQVELLEHADEAELDDIPARAQELRREAIRAG